jgi:hypothetical protein
MSIQSLFHWLFGPHMFDVGAVLCIGIGLAMALSTDPKDIQAALWFFGIAALLALGRAGHWLVTDDSLPLPKPLLAAILFGGIGTLWIIAHSWAHGKLPKPVQAQPKTEEPKQVQATPSKPHLAEPLSIHHAKNDFLLFKASPLFTPQRKVRIVDDVARFRSYLSSLGLYVPVGLLPIGVGGNATNTAPTRDTTVSDNLSIESSSIDEPSSITHAYARYIIMKILLGPDISLLPAWAQAWTSPEGVARSTMEDVFRDYLNWSFWGKRLGDHEMQQGWLDSLWEIRERYGAEFSDSLVAYLIKSFASNASPPSIGNRPLTQPVSMPNPLVDAAIHSHLFEANRIVDNGDSRIATINDILRKHGVAVPQ